MVPGAGVDNSVWNRIGRTQCARRVQTRDGLHPPARIRDGSSFQVRLSWVCVRSIRGKMVPGAGVEPARIIHPRDFKSLASTNFATRATKEWHYNHFDFILEMGNFAKASLTPV